MINNYAKKWEILNLKKVTSEDEIVDILLDNRGHKTKQEKEEFLTPKDPYEISLNDLKIDHKLVNKAIKRVKKAIDMNEVIAIYGDYDADGVCATAIMWETLYKYTKKVLPYIPNRFSEGYGINADSILSLKESNPDLSLIITVDNGIVANEAIKKASELGIDIILTDHHQKGEILPDAYVIVHTDKISGAGISWIFCRELVKSLFKEDSEISSASLDLCAIGTIADQMPLSKANRSFAKFGLEKLNSTKRVGLNSIFETANIVKGQIGTYEINFQIAPRINAMGRLDSAMDSLRVLCTKNSNKAKDLAILLDDTNTKRQKVVEEVLTIAKEEAEKRSWNGVIVIAHESFHEGVIGLAASKIVEKYYLPAIVIAKGQDISKASARSITGFNIIESIREHSHLILGGGGHPMAAGFSIENTKIEEFINSIDKSSQEKINDETKTRKLKIDLNLDLKQINPSLYQKLLQFEPTGIQNATPVFATKKLVVKDIKIVGNTKKHIKLALSHKKISINAIGFNMADLNIKTNDIVDIAYTIESNTWNGNTNIELRLKDIKHE